jgi:hypothetical protein
MEHCAAVTDTEVTHLAPDAARVAAPATADAAAAGDLGQQRIAPVLETIPGKRPRLAASCV